MWSRKNEKLPPIRVTTNEAGTLDLCSFLWRYNGERTAMRWDAPLRDSRHKRYYSVFPFENTAPAPLSCLDTPPFWFEASTHNLRR
jgi:hypothetical protein